MISDKYYAEYNQNKERETTRNALDAMQTIQKYCATHHKCSICIFSIDGECFLRKNHEPSDWAVWKLVD